MDTGFWIHWMTWVMVNRRGNVWFQASTKEMCSTRGLTFVQTGSTEEVEDQIFEDPEEVAVVLDDMALLIKVHKVSLHMFLLCETAGLELTESGRRQWDNIAEK